MDIKNSRKVKGRMDEILICLSKSMTVLVYDTIHTNTRYDTFFRPSAVCLEARSSSIIERYIHGQECVVNNGHTHKKQTEQWISSSEVKHRPHQGHTQTFLDPSLRTNRRSTVSYIRLFPPKEPPRRAKSNGLDCIRWK